MATATMSLADRVRGAFGNGRTAALREWRAAVAAAVTEGTEPDTATLERIAPALGVHDDVAETFAADCAAFDAEARLRVGAESAAAEYANRVKKSGTPESIRERAEKLRADANALDDTASQLEGLRTGGNVERLQARTIRAKHPRVWDAEAR